MIAMLAFELYWKNNDSKTGDVWFYGPIKKIFYKNGTWKVDEKTKEEYGSDTKREFSALQRWLSMPLSTTDPEELNIPDYTTGTRSESPYIIIKGTLTTNKPKESSLTKNKPIESSLTLSIGNESSKIQHVIDISTKQSTEKQSNQVSLKLEKEGYEINGESVFDLYVESGIINRNGVLNKREYEKIIKKFRGYIKPNKLQDPRIGDKKFLIYLLPSDEKVSYNGEI